MQGTVIVDGYAVNYIAKVKKIKGIYLHVRQDYVDISMPRGVSKQCIEQGLTEKIAFIRRAQSRITEQINSAPKFADGGSVILGGHRYIIKVDTSASKIVINGDNLVIGGGGNSLDIQAEFLAVMREVARENIAKALEKVLPLFSPYNIAMPKVIMKDLLSAWGMCRKSSNTITFNNALGLAPYQCVEYVVFHELSHLVVANHSTDFYRVLTSVMPNWKISCKLLKTIELRSYIKKLTTKNRG